MHLTFPSLDGADAEQASAGLYIACHHNIPKEELRHKVLQQ
jgi:hypothetical protein